MEHDLQRDNSQIIDWDGWLASPPGRYLLDWEQAAYDRAVSDIFGFHALQLGMPALDCLRENRMPWQGRVEEPGEPGVASAPAAAVRSRFDELPIASQSVDLVVLPHVLDFAHDPHAVLREVERILVPEGKVVLTGFNPMSLWGLRQGCSRLGATRFVPREGQFLANVRVKDWLKLLGLEIDGGRFGCYRPPLRRAHWLERMALLEPAGDRWWPIFGATYMLSAVKRVRGMRLVGRAWRAQTATAPGLAPAGGQTMQPRRLTPKEKDSCDA